VPASNHLHRQLLVSFGESTKWELFGVIGWGGVTQISDELFLEDTMIQKQHQWIPCSKYLLAVLSVFGVEDSEYW
jgi:hypothetical protein